MAHETKEIKGEVWYVSFTPGHLSLNLRIREDGKNLATDTYQLHIGDKEPYEGWGVPEITTDGERLTGAELLAWLLSRDCRVTLHLITKSYGSATKADFQTTGKDPRPI